jgi:hypothetical protein
MSMEGRRQVIVRISAEFIEALCSGTRSGEWVRGDGGVPPDAKCTGVCYELNTNSFLVRFEHESFRLVHPGSLAPGFPAPNVTKLHGAEIVADLAAGRIGVSELADVLGVPRPEVLAPPPMTSDERRELEMALRSYPPGKLVVMPVTDAKEMDYLSGADAGPQPHVVGE